MATRSIAILALGAALTALVLAPFSSARRQTTAPGVYVDIHVTLTDSSVILTPKTAPRGADARFIVRNVGTKPHKFTIGSLVHGRGFQTGFSRIFKPKEHQILLLLLDRRGPISYFGGNSAASAPARMKGTFVVGDQCTLCVTDY